MLDLAPMNKPLRDASSITPTSLQCNKTVAP